jgi:cysteine desulfurase
MALKLPIYLDNHSTTAVDPRVLQAMLPYFTEKFGNAASRNHAFGWEAEAGVEAARAQIAALIHADPKEIVFTSGATESNNLALKGVAAMYREKGDHIITVATEHRAILDTAKRLEKEGLKVTYLPVPPDGIVNPDDVRNAITDRTILISVMMANNEIGTINPVAEIGKIAKERGVVFHSDATQGVGKIGGCAGDGNRRDVVLRAQALWSQGRGGALRATTQPAGPVGRSDGRRRARARHALRHASGAVDRGVR